PAVIVVGDVAALRAELAWFEQQPLFGRRVLVTRSEDQAADLVEALLSAGAEPRVLPMIRVLPAEDTGPLDAALARLGDYDFGVWTSANGVRFACARARALGVEMSPSRAVGVCVGPATAEAARAAGLPVDVVPDRRDAEGVLELLR